MTKYSFLIESHDLDETTEVLDGLDLAIIPTDDFVDFNEYVIVGQLDDVREAARRLDADEEDIIKYRRVSSETD